MTGAGSEGGFTLVELVTVLCVVSLVASVTAASLASRSRQPMTVRERLEAARDSAARTGSPVTLVLDTAASAKTIRLLPDGRAIGDGIDPLTGALRDADR